MPKLIIQKLHNIGPWSVGIIIHDTVGAQLAWSWLKKTLGITYLSKER